MSTSENLAVARRAPTDKPSVPTRLKRSRPHLVWLVIVGALIAWPLAQMVKMGLEDENGAFTLSNYANLFTSSDALIPLRNSLLLSTCTTVLAVAIGLAMAFMCTRTNMPGRSILNISAIVAFALPNFISALGWLLLLGPRGGEINKWFSAHFGLEGPLFDVMSFQGLLLVFVTSYWPIAFLPINAAMSNMDPRLEEAAQSMGASRWRSFRKITLPLLTPATAAGALLVFVYSFMSFGPVAILGTPVGFDTMPTYMYRLMAYPPQLVTAAVIAVPSLIMLGVLIVIQRRLAGGRSVAVVGGKPGIQARLNLGAFKWPLTVVTLGIFVISFVLPIGMLIITSFRKAVGSPLTFENLVLTRNYERLFETPAVMQSMVTSMVLASVGTFIALALAFYSAWLLERRRSPLNALVTPIMMLPTAFSGVILGVALILAYGRAPLALTGTWQIILIAYVIQALPLAFIYVHAGLQQVHRDLEDVARTMGASMPRIVVRIQAPILSKSLLAAGLLSFIFLFRELDVSVFLFTGSVNVTGVILFGLATQNRFAIMGAMGTILVLISLVVVVLVYLLTERGTRRGAKA